MEETQECGLSQGSVLAPLLFNIYTNDQPQSANTRCFIYADDLAVAAQHSTFETVEQHLTSALSSLAEYYEANDLKANPAKTQVCAFHLRNREVHRKLDISWYGSTLDNCEHPVYLGVTLDRSLTFKRHVEKTRAKVCTRNNIIRKLSSTQWGASPSTIRSTALALCMSTAEYACPVWERSAHAKKLDPVINSTCRLITGCLKPTPTDDLYSLSGIAPPDIRRRTASCKERMRQLSDPRHPLYGTTAARKRLKSRKSFLNVVEPQDPEEYKLRMWKERRYNLRNDVRMAMPVAETLPPGFTAPWAEWKCLNRLRTGVGRCKANLKKWGYKDDDNSTDNLCQCGAEQTMAHLLRCPCLPRSGELQDLAGYNETAKECVAIWCKQNI